MKLFVFGTLRDAAIYEAVTGESPKIITSDYSLPGHASYYVLGENYPGLVLDKEMNTSGIILDVSPEALERLIKYEDPDDYELKEVGSFGQEPLYCFMSKRDLELSSQAWDFEEFMKRGERELIIKKIGEWMK
jgi:gamma-glutamylcyclotransferase (GGCT)/AIG2-like uncharacterized protein YtfP